MHRRKASSDDGCEGIVQGEKLGDWLDGDPRTLVSCKDALGLEVCVEHKCGTPRRHNKPGKGPCYEQHWSQPAVVIGFGHNRFVIVALRENEQLLRCLKTSNAKRVGHT